MAGLEVRARSRCTINSQSMQSEGSILDVLDLFFCQEKTPPSRPSAKRCEVDLKWRYHCRRPLHLDLHGCLVAWLLGCLVTCLANGSARMRSRSTSKKKKGVSRGKQPVRFIDGDDGEQNKTG